MSYITLNSNKLSHNYNFLNQLFREKNIEWAVVGKLLCGNEKFLQCLLNICDKEICDSRLTNLRHIKKISPTTQTVYIKPPAKRLVKSIVQFADVSFNTEIDTIKALSEEAVRQNRTHKIVIMVEMGELREGIMVKNLSNFYGEVLQLPNIDVVGIGTNLNCLNGILPDEKKLIKLSRFKEIIEESYNEKIPYISAGSSVTIPLLFQNLVPEEINHFRIGETLFFGTDVYNDSTINGMYQDVFKLTTEIIEIVEKPMIPAGDAGTNLTGETPIHDQNNIGKTSVRAIVDIGILDIDPTQINPINDDIEIIGASSDMMILDLSDNLQNYQVGDTVDFSMNYMAVLRAMNSDYVDKIVDNKLDLKRLKILEDKN
ncbi:alanine/ornithine racemase family PLP-dependent enzyme [Chryseobacterium wangxinyae]|uniref:alanine/ornithine racemase family PLP-dependent enzyme n=1 Tax=Chryseobacterium sp. CY350 TaxID=2997336 RepID=UPI0022702179|nr:alanine/ornithine racemase family PLP-dependent enzyme [Chryseobacterium sp. CY350]MCY0978198.1 alanine/ornithine racemase family PLP-dependent enzyme [Chryseobacterium sp. CY350]WBZ95978.1 alanine/ornithine racemase family PLP-dependent enzyme [Chryseobacterium sp. CY350]